MRRRPSRVARDAFDEAFVRGDDIEDIAREFNLRPAGVWSRARRRGLSRKRETATIPCLTCGEAFESEDRSRNRICPDCLEKSGLF